MTTTRTVVLQASAVDQDAPDELHVGGRRWVTVLDEQEVTSRIIRRSLMCADLVQQGYVDADGAVRQMSMALLAAELDRAGALRLAHAWLGRHIPSGKVAGRSIDDVDLWRQSISGPNGSDEDRRWLAWGVAIAAAELSARTFPWDAPAAALLDLLVAEGYDPAPWEQRESRRCRSLRW